MRTDIYPTNDGPIAFYRHGKYISCTGHLKTMTFSGHTSNTIVLQDYNLEPVMFDDELDFAPLCIEGYGFKYGVFVPVDDRMDLPTPDVLERISQELQQRISMKDVIDTLGTEDAVECAYYALSDNYVLAYCLQENEYTVDAAERVINKILNGKDQQNQSMVDSVLDMLSDLGLSGIDFGDGVVHKAK